MEQELYTLLAGLLSPYKVYPSIVPLNAAYPCARYVLIYNDFEQTKDTALSGLARYQLDIYSRDTISGESAFNVALGLGEDVKIGLNGHTGIEIREIRINNVEDDYQEETEAHIKRIEFNVYHT
jgi:hypothetical protein